MTTRNPTTPGRLPAGDVGRAAPDRSARWVLPLALLAVAVTFGTAVVRVLTGVDESFRYGGDQAMAGLAVDEASSFDRDLGPYSRYGWSHPGPVWFYLLAPATRLLGGDDAALIAATVLVNGLLAAAVVVVVHRERRPALTLAVTALVLVFLLRMPSVMFLDAWSPYALLLGTLLLLVLAARVHTGSWSDLLALLVVGSFLVQTHVGSAPLVAIVGATSGTAFLLGRRRLRRTAGSEPLSAGAPWYRRRGPVVLAVVLVAVWLPPLVQQLSSPVKDGNLVRLAGFLLHHEDGGSPTPFQALVGVGRILAMTPYGWGTGPLEMEVDDLTAPVALALAGQVLVSVGLVVLGRRWGSRAGFWWGVVTLAALAAAIVSAATVTGELFWYLIVWVAVLPVATAIGVVHLVLDRLTAGRDAAAAPDRAPVAAALGVVVLAGSVAAAVSLGGAVADLPASPEVTEASQLVEDGLADVEGRTVHLDMTPHELWPIGAGVARGLVSDGWRVSVDPEFTDLFGSGRADPDGGPVEVLLVATGSAEHDRLAGEAGVRDLGTIGSGSGPVAILLRTAG